MQTLFRSPSFNDIQHSMTFMDDSEATPETRFFVSKGVRSCFMSQDGIYNLEYPVSETHFAFISLQNKSFQFRKKRGNMWSILGRF